MKEKRSHNWLSSSTGSNFQHCTAFSRSLKTGVVAQRISTCLEYAKKSPGFNPPYWKESFWTRHCGL